MSSQLWWVCAALLNLCTVCPMDVTEIWGEKKNKTGKQNKDCSYISPRIHQRERERAFALEEFLHVPQNSPNGPLEESRSLGTDCMKSFDLHKMFAVALSQASSWQLLRVSNNSSKISIYSQSLFSDPV